MIKHIAIQSHVLKNCYWMFQNQSIRNYLALDHVLIIGELKELLKEDVRSQVRMVKEEMRS